MSGLYSKDSMWTRKRAQSDDDDPIPALATYLQGADDRVRHYNSAVEIDRLRSALTRILAVDRLPACARNIARDALAVQVTP